MDFFLRYLRYCKGKLLLLLGCVGICAVVFFLYGLPLTAVLYAGLLCAALCAGYGAWRLRKALCAHRRISVIESLEEADLPPAYDICQEDYRLLLRRLAHLQLQKDAQAQKELKERTDYYTVWAHQIKTPIASMSLTLQELDSAPARNLRSELNHIEQYVDMAMTYLRLDSDATDYVFHTCRPDTPVRQAIRRFGSEFIHRGLNLCYTPLEFEAVTDEKWLRFVLEQILSTALKYTPKGSISIFPEDPKTICIQDTGIGIAPEDLPRVFEQGYTGSAGRAYTQASGIGLYLCHRICRNLGHTISIASVPDVGTTVRICLAQSEGRRE